MELQLVSGTGRGVESCGRLFRDALEAHRARAATALTHACYTGRSVIRRLAAAAIVAICIGGPIVEVLDRWDHTIQDGNDTEANVVIAAVCVGVAFAVRRTLMAVGLSLPAPGDNVVPAMARPRASVAPPHQLLMPTGSSPTPLRV